MSSFTVYAEPQGKARARTVHSNGGVHSYTPKNTKKYEELIAYEYKKQCGKFYGNITGTELKQPVEIEIIAYFSIPKSYSKDKRLAAEKNIIRPTKKPDADNIAKAVCDALNGVAYEDDTQAVVLCVYKLFTKDKPRIEVTVRGI